MDVVCGQPQTVGSEVQPTTGEVLIVLHRQLAMLALGATALAVAGCGGSSKAGMTATKTSTSSLPPAVAPSPTPKLASGRPLSRSVWVAKANAICARTNARVKASKIKSRQEFARVIPQIALYEKTAAVELAELVPPRNKTGDWQKIVTGFRLTGEYLTKVATMVRDESPSSVQSSRSLVIAGNEARTRIVGIATADGLKSCAAT
jgi:hypothetical protein